MKFRILCNTDWEAKLDKVLSNLSALGFKSFFEKKQYGNALDGVVVVLMCRDSAYQLKQRIRFYKAEKTLYMDIMLNLDEIKTLEQPERNRLVAQRLITEISPVIAKYKFKEFDSPKFEKDLQKWFKKSGLLSASTRENNSSTNS
jgi:hypothetical protein